MTEQNGGELAKVAPAVVLDDPEFLRGIVERVLQTILEGTDGPPGGGTATSARGADRLSQRLVTARAAHAGRDAPAPRAPDRDGTCSTELFALYQRCEQVLVTTLVERSRHGLSTAKVRAVTEEVCGTSVSKRHVSARAGRLDGELEA